MFLLTKFMYSIGKFLIYVVNWQNIKLFDCKSYLDQKRIWWKSEICISGEKSWNSLDLYDFYWNSNIQRFYPYKTLGRKERDFQISLKMLQIQLFWNFFLSNRSKTFANSFCKMKCKPCLKMEKALLDKTIYNLVFVKKRPLKTLNLCHSLAFQWGNHFCKTRL